MSMKCPWYNNGLCYSPKTLREFGEPSDKPVSGICVTEQYTTCKYYTEPSSSEQSLESFEKYEKQVPGLKSSIEKLYLPIHMITPSMKSECPYFTIISFRDENGNVIYVAKCKVLDRFLTRSHVIKCISYWRECPFQAMAHYREELV